MQIACSTCKKDINIPDDKVPKDKAFNITCPHCREKNRVDQHLPAAPAAAAAAGDGKKDEAAAPLVESPAFEDDEAAVFYGENDRVALILDEAHRDIWTRELEALGYKLQYAKSPEHAEHKVKFTQFHLIALHENFGNVTLENSAIYQALLAMAMTTRRKMFVALTGQQFKTGNNMQAFAASVNMVIQSKDMPKMAPMLKNAIAENETFYKVFRETLTACGKI